jgi:hypothetical protein
MATRHRAVTLTAEECRAAYGLIDELSGGNAANVFAWDGTDDPADALHRAVAKLFAAAGVRVPDELKDVAAKSHGYG